MKKEKTPPATAEKQTKPAKRKRVTLSNVDAIIASTDTAKVTYATSTTIVTDAVKATDVSNHKDMAAINNADSSNHEEAPCNQEVCDAETDNQHKTNVFPIEILHSRLQGILNEAKSTLGFPTDYLAGAMLTAMSSAIGNTYMVEHMAHISHGNYSKL